MNVQEFNHYVVANWNRHGDKVRTETEHLLIMSLGLSGEAGEVQEHIKKFVRDGRPIGREFLLECGDCLHYLVRCANQFGFTLQEVIDANVEKLDARHGVRK